MKARTPSSVSSANSNPPAPILCKVEDQSKYIRIVKHARLVRTDSGAPETAGKFLPCYALDVPFPDWRVVLPLKADSRDTSLDTWFESAKKAVTAHADAVIQILVRARHRMSPTGAFRTTTGTGFIVESSDRLHTFICTTLHTFIDSGGWGFNGSNMKDVEVWVAKDVDRRRDDLFTRFDGLKDHDVLLESRGFEKLELVQTALTERVEILKEFAEQKTVEQSFLDPEFGLYAIPILDVTFLHLPESLKQAVEKGNITPLRIASSAPVPNQPFVAIAYHDNAEELEDEVYCGTLEAAKLQAKDFVHAGRSCTLGKFSGIGSILTTSFNSTCGTSGCPLIDENGRVYGINMASYYDQGEEDTSTPTSTTSGSSDRPAAESEQPEEQDALAWIGPFPVEAGDATAMKSRNRNIALSVRNPGFTAIWDAVCGEAEGGSKGGGQSRSASCSYEITVS
ncbi:hypothetical protein HDV00_005075 [Rhizophlyctis rosea]|nr:hypothetical protein HDV00_005075 [Rhizophlyctis rosea]